MALNFIMHKYRIMGKKGEGTFSEVLKCQNIQDGTYYACKKMKQSYDSLEQVNSLREVQAMRRLSPHNHILELHEVLFDKKSGVMVIICELMDMNIYELIKGKRKYLAESKCQMFLYQLLKSLAHLHRNGIFHRDVKPENILIKDEKLLKLADFGSCRSMYSKQPYTEYISTRWYRAPECLLTDGYYSFKMDIWSVGCVFFEILSLRPLFPGANEVDQIAKIHDIMGTPEPNVLNKLRNRARGMNFNFPQKKGCGLEKYLPHSSSEAIDLIYQLVAYDPDERITAKQAMRHPYFKELRDEDKRNAIALKPQRATESNASSTVQQSSVKSEKSLLPYSHNNKENATDVKSDTKKDKSDILKPIENNKIAEKDTDKTKDKIDKDQRNIKEKDKEKDSLIENIKDNNKSNHIDGTLKITGEISRKRTPPGARTGKVSPVQGVRYPASVIHSTYQYQKRERERERERRRRRQRQNNGRMAESGPNPVHSFFPKVAPPVKPSSYNSTYHSNQFGSNKTSLPKLTVDGNSPGSTTTYLPSLTQAFVKPTKTKNVAATKNMYGAYQLPSIDRRGAGY